MNVKNIFQDIPNEVFPDSPNFWELLQDRFVEVDMGCGHGDFMLEFAPKYPERLFVGVEVARKRVFKTSNRLHKRGIENYRVVYGDGALILNQLFPNQSVDVLHINFPDPWLRKKQWKNRILKPSFLMDVHRVLKPRGKLNFVSDVEEYALYVADLIEGYPFFRSNYKQPVMKNLYESFPTLFYRKMSPLRSINYLSYSPEKF